MRVNKANYNNDNIGYYFILPALVFMLVFIAYPVISNIILSFQDVNVMTIASKVRAFTGFNNYRELLKGSILRIAFINTFIFTICSLSIQFTIGFAFALLLNRNSRLVQRLRGIMMIAWMIPIAVTALLFKFMFSVNGGIINQILLGCHLVKAPVEWLLHPASAMASIIMTNIWVAIPFNMILISTGLTSISAEIYESANLDGANAFQKFFQITLPLLKPSLEAVLILGFVNTFKVFDLVFVMTGGGPVNSTHLLSTFSYDLSFVQFDFSKGAAVANILFAVLFVVGLGYVKLIKQEEEVM